MAQDPMYFAPAGNLPPQTAMITSKAVLRPEYAILPGTSITDNVRSALPGWLGARCWILASPAMGLAAGFTQYLIFLATDGHCEKPEPEEGVESFLFVLDGELTVAIDDGSHLLRKGGFAFAPAGSAWSLRNTGRDAARFLWLRKPFEPLAGHGPSAIAGHEQDVPRVVNRTSESKWTTNLIPVDDLAYDMHMNIVSFGPGTIISAIEMHVMEHGLYMLQGKGMYLLNDRWHEVEAGDFIWMRAFCPQAFVASGPEPARYLLYKNVNRQVSLRSPGRA
jgi:(S)-ureidoglycine aminohydrolase